jgi:hypothetical protein
LIRGETVPNWQNRVPVPVIVPRLGSTPSSAAALVGAGDPASSRLVYAMVIGLIVIGLLLIALGIWIVRQTRVDLDVLAPLERMGDGEWKKRDRSTQRRMLDEVRPEGARPLTPATRPPSLDDEFELDEHPVTSFSDLGPGVPSEERDPTPVGNDAEPVIEPIAEAVVEAEVDAEVDPELEPVLEAEDDADAEPGIEPLEAAAEPAPEAEPQSEPEPEPEPEPESESESEPESAPELRN